jgi:thiamine transport system substrate-binding protein
MSGKKIALGLFLLAMVVFAAGLIYRFSDLKNHARDRAQAANLVVFANSSFIDAYGPGLDLKTEFEKTCVCTVEYVDAGGASEVIEKLRLDPSRRVDVILGLDYLQLKRISEVVSFQKLPATDIPFVPEIRDRLWAQFRAYDWSPMGFVYRQGEAPVVSSWSEILTKWPDKSVSLQDPTLSAPGLVWLYHFLVSDPVASYDEKKAGLPARLEKWKDKVHSYSPSWSGAYGIFRNKQVPATYSYLTSLLYHWQIEGDRSYQFMTFTEGHPLQIEYAAVPESCWNCNVAKRFVELLGSAWAQKILAEKNFMLPVRAGVDLPSVFQDLPKFKALSVDQVENFVNDRQSLLDIWKAHR